MPPVEHNLIVNGDFSAYRSEQKTFWNSTGDVTPGDVSRNPDDGEQKLFTKGISTFYQDVFWPIPP